MKKYIVTTTINPVTEAIYKYQKFDDWELVVVGDRNTPKNYHLNRGKYLTPEEQENYDKNLSDAIGWNCIERRNFGFLWAYENGADIVATIDDDNIPYDFWGKELHIGKEISVNFYNTKLPAFDPIGATEYPHLWHRGYPLPLVSKREYNNKRTAIVTPDIQADFWNGDPDIDAICRMEHAPDVTFSDKSFPIASNKPAPFNSQNTFIGKKALKDYFVFPHIGRMDDIWASYYVQALGHTPIFNKATVQHQRNKHNLIEDMKGEYLGYEKNLALLSDLQDDPSNIQKYLPKRAYEAFNLYRAHFK